MTNEEAYKILMSDADFDFGKASEKNKQTADALCLAVKALEKQIAEEEKVTSHSELEIVKGCIALMHELTDEFENWYRWVHGEDAIESLDEEEMFCLRMTYFHIVQRLLLYGTSHSGGTSTRQKCGEIGIKDWSDEVSFEFEREEENE